ncbi:hypothetical protein PMAYCL1PPCAC_18976 [Pristionchus mayeri]|uniref:Paqr-1 n=1 Tax=Pristionchus mayeri TaxID=1317129 RepID=A0AAN5I2M7_9BILA|nr:hypothetical protein PMAYCL1PPCAC_18976 [Pristionchus mayeri]
MADDSAIRDALEDIFKQQKGSASSESLVERSTTVQVHHPERKISLGKGNSEYEITLSKKTVTSQPNSDDEEDWGTLSDSELIGYRSRKHSFAVRAGSDDEGLAPRESTTTIKYRRRRGGQWRRLEKEDGLRGDEDELQVNVCENVDDKGIVTTTVEATWKVLDFESLPDWLQDNEFLRSGYRPPLPSVAECFKSIWSLHTETGNIWTHLIGCVLFAFLATWFLTRPDTHIQFQEKLIFSFFFVGAIVCLGLSFAFHTLSCHSKKILKLFCKLDYMGISMLIVGSFIPWIYYGFYCRREPKITYIVLICILGVAGGFVSMLDKFSEVAFRPIRAGVFVAMGASGVIPAVHYMLTDGIDSMFNENAFHWLLLMAGLYLTGAALYATRTPERFFPGKCDIWFQSHQLFHTCVVIAALVHYYGISEMAMVRLNMGCPAETSVHPHDEL